MSITHTKNYSVSSTGGGSPLSGSFSDVAASEINLDNTFAASTVNQLVTMAITLANVQSIFVVSDKGCTIKTNSTGSPGNTIVLQPGIPLSWSASETYYSNPFTSNVTCWYVSTTVAARLQVKILTN